MSGRSSIDSLRRLAPVSDSDAAAVFGAAAQEELLAGVTQLPFGRGAHPRLTPRRRRFVLAAVALALVAIATAATWVIAGSPARETTSVQCLIGKSDAVIPATSGDPAHDCAVDYRREFGTGAPQLARLRQRPRRRHGHPSQREAPGRLEAARLRAGRRFDPAPGLAGRLRQRTQLELPG